MADDTMPPAGAALQPILKTGATLADLAWAAGLFEGEGSISHGPSSPSCDLAMADEDVVRRFHAVVGIGSVCLSRRKTTKDLWWWKAAGYPSAQYVIALFWRWLGERRRARAVEELTRFAARPPGNEGRRVLAGGGRLPGLLPADRPTYAYLPSAQPQGIFKTGATVLDLAWAAGLFEGEGHIGRQKKAPRCGLSSTDDDVIRRFHAIVGVGSISKIAQVEGRKPAQAWMAAGFPTTQHVIAILWRWLGERRRAKAVEVLAISAAEPARRKDFCKRGHDLNDPANTIVTALPGGRQYRVCRLCQRITNTAWAARTRKARRIATASQDTLL